MAFWQFPPMKIAALATSFVIGFGVGLALFPAKFPANQPTISADHHKKPVVYEMQRRFQN